MKKKISCYKKMSLSLRDINISQQQTFNNDKIAIRYYDDKIYICKVEDNGTIQYGAELVLDSIPAEAIYGTNGNAAAQVLASQISLDLDLANWDEQADGDAFKAAILSGIGVEDAIVEITSLAAGSVVIDYTVTFADTVDAASVTQASTALSDAASVTTKLQEQGGSFSSVQATVTVAPTVSQKVVPPAIIGVSITPGLQTSVPSLYSTWTKPADHTWYQILGRNAPVTHNGGDLYVSTMPAQGGPTSAANDEGKVYIYKVNASTNSLEDFAHFDINDYPGTQTGNGYGVHMSFLNNVLYWFGVNSQIIKVEAGVVSAHYTDTVTTWRHACTTNNHFWFIDNDYKVYRLDLDGTNKLLVMQMSSNTYSIRALIGAGTTVYVLVVTGGPAPDLWLAKIEETDGALGSIDVQSPSIVHQFSNNHFDWYTWFAYPSQAKYYDGCIYYFFRMGQYNKCCRL